MSVNIMEVEEAFKIGVLFSPPQSFLRKTWPKRFCALYKASNHGIQRLEVFDSEEAFLKQSKSPSKLILLTDCVKATAAPQKQQANVFEVRTKSNSYLFSTDSFQGMMEWLGALQAVAFGSLRPSTTLSASSHIPKDVKHEENLLYSSMDEPEVFFVSALETEATSRNNLNGNYKLIITSVNISLAEDISQNRVGKIILTWPYRHIRRYGCSKDNFSFEAGRKCVSGEGLFAFSTKDGGHIFQSVDTFVTSLKSSQCDMDIPGSPPFDEKSHNVFLCQGADVLTESHKNQTSVSCAESNMHINVHKAQNRKMSSRQDNEIPVSFLTSEQVTFKPTYPMSKPPRKSKINSNSSLELQDGNCSPLNISKISQVDMNCVPNVYDEPQNFEKLVEFQRPMFENYLPSEFDAEVLVCEDENLIPSSSEPVYALLEDTLSNNFDLSALNDEVKQVLTSNKTITSSSQQFTGKEEFAQDEYPIKDSDSYDHISLKKIQNSRLSVKNYASDHVYGKLLPIKSSSVMAEPQHSSMYASVQLPKQDVLLGDGDCDTNHCYTNVEVKKSVTSTVTNLNNVDSMKNELKHFVHNNAEYAQVYKNSNKI